MVRVIYGDILLLIDFCMNFFILYTTAIVLRRKIKITCMGIAAFVGSIYSVAKLFVSGNNIADCIISLCVGILMCYIAFGAHAFFKVCIVFSCTSALLGGIMLGGYFLMGSYHTDIFGNMGSYAYSHIPIWLFLVLAAISLLLSWSFSYIGREHSDKKEESVGIEYMGRVIDATLLLDSGNLTKEPISGKYVIMLNKSKSRRLLGEELYAMVIEKDTENLLAKRFRIVYVTGIRGDTGLMYAFLPQKLYIRKQNRDVELEAYIAVCNTDMSFGGCDGIVHPSVVL